MSTYNPEQQFRSRDSNAPHPAYRTNPSGGMTNPSGKGTNPSGRGSNAATQPKRPMPTKPTTPGGY